MNRLQFLALLRKTFAYEGDGSLASVKSYIKDNGVEIKTKDGSVLSEADIEKMFAKKVTVSISADAGEEVEISDGSDGDGGSNRQPLVASDVEPATVSASLSRNVDVARKSAGKAARVEAPMRGLSAEHRLYERRSAKGLTAFRSADECIRFGKTVIDILTKSQTLGTNSAGGYTVPTDVQADLIENLEKYGVFRKYADYRPMARDKMNIPKKTGRLTVYSPSEASSITASDIAFGQVALDAIKFATWTAVSNELDNDSVLNIGEVVMTDIAESFALAEDRCGFVADGTSGSPHFSQTGVTEAAKAAVVAAGGTWATDGNKSYLPTVQVATGSTWASITIDDLRGVMANLPAYAFGRDAAWYCSQAFWGQVIYPRASGVAGATATEQFNGQVTPMLFGFPVRITQAMPTATAVSQIPLIFGSLKSCAVMGEVQGTTLVRQFSEVLAQSDALGIRGVERVAFNVHDVGTAHATAGSRIAGPMAFLATKQS